jgi:ferredoxin
MLTHYSGFRVPFSGRAGLHLRRIFVVCSAATEPFIAMRDACPAPIEDSARNNRGRAWSNNMTDEACKQPHDKLVPLVDFSRCEAKGPCAEVCPYDVFEIRKIERSDYARLG